MSDVLKNKRVLLIRLPVSELGKTKVAIIGGLLLAQLLATKGKAHLYIADPWRFTGSALIEMTADPRFNLTVSNQYLGELADDLQASLFGNMDQRIYFRTGIEDSERIHKTIPHDNTTRKLHELHPHEARHFEGSDMWFETHDPLEAGSFKLRKKIENQNRLTYARNRKAVKARIDTFLGGVHEDRD